MDNAELILHGINQPGGCLREKFHRRYLHDELITSIIDKTPEYYDDSVRGTSGVFSSMFNSNFENIYNGF